MAGPLSGLTIVELAGIGPGPMCSMMLGDMGADVIRVDRTKAHVMDRLADPKFAVHNRSRRSVSVDLQKKEGVEVVLRLIEKADGITEPFRPGVAERLGLGPDVCLARNPRLVYGRMTGWGQEGPLAKAAGHDINYIALTGALHAIGVKDKPTPPLNLVGDFGGGGMLLAFGMVCGLLEAQRSGKGQVIDAAMVDGAALLLGGIYGMAGAGLWNDNDRETNMLDGGAHFYGTYETKDGKFVSHRLDRAAVLRRAAAREDRPQGREPAGADGPQGVGAAQEPAGRHLPHQDARRMVRHHGRHRHLLRAGAHHEGGLASIRTPRRAAPIVDVSGFPQPAPAPRFSRTKESIKGPAAKRGQHTDEVLGQRGFSAKEIGELKAAGVVGPQ